MPQSLNDLIKALDAHQAPLSLDELARHIQALEVSAESLQSYLHFDTSGYQRNLIHQTEHYQILLLCWENGQRSPIHDHIGSNCVFKVLEGVATESHFTHADNGMIIPTKTRRLAVGDYSQAKDDIIHQVSNLQAEDKRLISLHIYSPCLGKTNTYSLVSAEVETYQEPVFELMYGAGI